MNWKQNLWVWWSYIRFTPIVLAVLVLWYRHLVPDTEDSQAIILLWTAVSGGSLVFMGLLMQKTGRMVKICKRELVDAQDRGDAKEVRRRRDFVIHERNLHSNTIGIFTVHLLFMTLGISEAVPLLPEWLRGDIALMALLTGQYILFLVALRAYLAAQLAWHGTEAEKRIDL